MMLPDEQLTVPDLRSAHRQVRRSARRLVRTWRQSLAAIALLGVAFVCSAAWMWTYPDASRIQVLLYSLWTVYFAYEFIRFLPRKPPPDTASLALEGAAAAEAEAWVAAATDGWRPSRILLQTEAAVDLDLRGDLRIGAPLVACLREEELALLVRHARRVRGPLLDRRLARVHRLLTGRLGRGLDVRLSLRWGLASMLFRRLDGDAQLFLDSLARWDAAADGDHDQGTTDARGAQRVVAEGFELMVDSYLIPALHLGVWHDDPFTGVRHVLTAWEEIGADVWGESRGGSVVTEPPQAHQILPTVMSRELELAERMLGDHPREERPTAWSDHPERVAVRLWRKRTAAVLEAGRVATGHPQRATLAALVALVEDGWSDAMAAHLVGPDLEDEPPDSHPARPADRIHAVTSQALTDLVVLTLLGTGAARLAWSWREGGHLVDAQGVPVDVAEVVAHTHSVDRPGRLDDLLDWVAQRGADPTAPVWLDGGLDPGPEMPLNAFGALRRLRSITVVVSDRAIHLFRSPLLRASRLRFTDDEDTLQSLMDAVRHGDSDAQVGKTLWADVVAARLRSTRYTGSAKLSLRTSEGSVAVTSWVSAAWLASVLEPLLGDRLALDLKDLWVPPWQGIGFWSGFTLFWGGTLAMFAVVCLIDPPGTMTREVAAALGVGGLVLVIPPGVRLVRR